MWVPLLPGRFEGTGLFGRNIVGIRLKAVVVTISFGMTPL